MMKKELLIEIGTEEIPAGFLRPALEALKDRLVTLFGELKIEHSEVKVFGTPRRMTIYIEAVDVKQPDIDEEVLGPPKKVAIDENGNYTKSAIGFATSQNVSIDELKIITKDKKEYIGFNRKKDGEKTATLLSNYLPDLILSLPFPKSMRWASGEIKFVRPIHWILALFGSEVIPFSITGINSSNYTVGHRFMAYNKIIVNSFDEYKKKLTDSFVMIDIDQRIELILREAKKIADEVNGIIDEDMELIETVANLCEYPFPMLGSFDSKFLSLPKEILITTMKKHQKYIPIFNNKGELLPHFIIVSNTMVNNPKTIIDGNSKVIKARFSDAEYYFEKDKKIPLVSRVESLKNVMFQEKLGTYFEKTQRLIELCDFLTSMIDPSLKDKAKRSALLSKADLVTGMVYEFPALQGIIGGELARLQNEDPDVAVAIYEHYLPQSPDDPIPLNPVGRILSLADKVDSLTGFFGLGIMPKGASDPYGLRRMAIGIIRLITEMDVNIDYTQIIRFAYENLKSKLTKGYDEIIKNLIEFIENRFYYQMQLSGYRVDIVESVISTHPVDLCNAKKIIEVMDKESRSELFNDLILGFKRVANITRGMENEKFDVSLFKEEVENKLYNSYLKAKESINKIIEKKLFDEIPVVLANLKPVIDEYFESVLVMDKDEIVKNNRLAFLVALRKVFSELMDFTKIQQ
ncbi:MAG: glycine--tRNA ligase subunit beta [Proteobacteria bacterium]|nr:glycine--tRNA ligase subunit beta [Pseudomonadota bacterium]